ncbi:hypothetical protein HYU21_01435 [Candidatus Woesearchaeota archaeon]|nr:hypothetical protein [Candidatus Woesearchaeota archaeon]
MKLQYDLLQAATLAELIGMLNQPRPTFTLIGTPRQEDNYYIQIIHTLVEERICGSSDLPSLEDSYSRHPKLLSSDAETVYTLLETFGKDEVYNQFGNDNPFVKEMLVQYEKSKKKKRV